MKRRWIERLERVKHWHLWCGLVALSIGLGESIVCAVELAIKGQVTSDYLITGLITSLIVGSIVVGLVVYFLRLIGELDVVWHQANFDALTGLPNRRLFQEHLEAALRRARRSERTVALLLLDVDRFSAVNDFFGYASGDELLVEATRRLQRTMRESDTVARLGGDEFGLILVDPPDSGGVEVACRRVLEMMAWPFVLGGGTEHTTASVGIAMFPQDAADAEMLLRNADQALGEAKNAGGNQWRFFDARMSAASKSKLQLASRRIIKAEALLRWRTAGRGPVSPAEFVPVAEQTGMIIEIGDWVLRQALAAAARWRARFGERIQVSVNVSPVQIREREGIVEPLRRHLAAAGLPGELLVVELTEGLLLDDNAKVRQRLQEIRGLGVEVAIDDFGTGYSSLAYLRKFDLDFLKIDQAFVRGLVEDSSHLALCEAIIVMAHKLGMKVIAEGIETEEQLRLLLASACDYGQGYFFGRPEPAEAFEARLENNPSAAAQRAQIAAAST